jgi:hypothetical protein
VDGRDGNEEAEHEGEAEWDLEEEDYDDGEDE